MILADDISKIILAADFLSQCLNGGQVPEGLNASHNIIVIVSEYGGAHADGYGAAFAVEDIDVEVDEVPAGFNCFSEGAGGLADVGAENVKTFLTQGLVSRNSNDFFSSAIKKSNVVFAVYREDPISNGIKNLITLFIGWFSVHFFILYANHDGIGKTVVLVDEKIDGAGAWF